MKKLFIAILLLSLLANFWQGRSMLGKGEPDTAATATSPASAAMKATQAAASVAEAARVATLIVAQRAAVEQALADGDIATLGETMKAAGIDALTIRAVADGVLWRRYQHKQDDARQDRLNYGWWRGGVPPANARSGPSLWADVNQPVRATFGRNPIDQAEAELRYSFLPPDKRRQLANIEIDYHEMRSNASLTRTQVEESRLLAQERERDVFNALTPEERTEYELRFGGGNRVASRFAAMTATETEARTIKPLLSSFEAQIGALPPNDPASAASITALERTALDQLVTKLGYERAVDFVWASTTGDYVPTLLAMRELNLPDSHAAQLFQLAAQTGLKAAAIHHDSTLTPPQKQAALTALQSTVTPRLDTLAPADSRAILPAAALTWYTDLAKGSYSIPRPTPLFIGTSALQRTLLTAGATSINVATGSQSINVSTPPRGDIPSIALPEQIGN